MTDYGDIRRAAGQAPGAAVELNFCRTAVNTSHRRFDLIPIDSTEARDLFRSVISAGETIMSRQERFDGATADKSLAATGAIETAPPGQYCAEPARGGQAIIAKCSDGCLNLSASSDEHRERSPGDLTWERLETVPPSDRDLEIAVIEGNTIHRVVFPCRRAFDGWIKAKTGEHVAVQPTHWRIWPK
ncbi:hypothetical protein [Bradyrhizobium vignae]|uniref:hypothetical protein n=1 Tax=Bradyrhizobium vignae TaxID=1549949 RepID=UPI001FDF70E3|nr:hypothetical protein [Bradyrhizobium vignae]